MTLTIPAPTTAPPAKGWLRRHRGLVVIGLGLVVATTFAAIGGDNSDYQAALDPGNSSPGGARAVARVLAHEGIDVDIVRDAAAFADATIDADTTVVVTSTENLGRATAREVVARTESSLLVLVDPGSQIPELFGAEEGVGYTDTKKVDAACSTDVRFDGLTLETVKGRVFPRTPNSCFATGGGALLTEPDAELYFLGAADLLANEQITRSDNAAIALRLLGRHPHLVWYVPDEADQSGSDGVSFSSLLPDWLGPGTVVACVSILGLMIWRGRRFGPLAVEPLPVAVTAIETTLSRGRLYRKANDRGYAAGALRHEARIRLAAHLLLPRQTADDVGTLVVAVAPYTQLDPNSLRTLLAPDSPAPTTDKNLINLANDLVELIREVRRS